MDGPRSCVTIVVTVHIFERIMKSQQKDGEQKVCLPKAGTCKVKSPRTGVPSVAES